MSASSSQYAGKSLNATYSNKLLSGRLELWFLKETNWKENDLKGLQQFWKLISEIIQKKLTSTEPS